MTNLVCNRPAHAPVAGGMPLDEVVPAFSTHIRALLTAGLEPAEIGGILKAALFEMGYGSAMKSVDFGAQIAELAPPDSTRIG